MEFLAIVHVLCIASCITISGEQFLIIQQAFLLLNKNLDHLIGLH